MPSPTVIPTRDPRARTLLGFCLALSCGFFILEFVAFLLMGPGLEEGPLRTVLAARHDLYALGRGGLEVAAAVGVLLHAGMAALVSSALQRMWLRNRKL